MIGKNGVVAMVVIAFFSLGLSALPARAQEGVALDAQRGIYLAEPASPAEQRALAQLHSGMKLLYGVDLPRAKEPAGAAILLGRKAALGSGLVKQEELDQVAPFGFAIKTGGGRLAIAGTDDTYTFYATARFLEKLGMRFYDGKQVVVAKPAAGAIPAMNLLFKPAVPYGPANSREFEWAMGDQALKHDVPGDTDVWIDHSAGYLVPKDLYYDAHPEYYSMLADGKRIAKDQFSYHGTPLCLSNPDVTKISIERALKWVAWQPNKTFFYITYGDTGAWCQCPACLKMDPAPGQYATRNLTWVNAVAEAVAQKYPDKIVTTFAYGGTDVPPPVIRPAKNVWVIGSVGFAGLPFWDQDMAAGLGQGSADKVDGWVNIAPNQFAICEYEGQYYPALVDTIAGKSRYYADKGLRGVFFTYGRPANFYSVWNYIYPRLLWEPNLDAQALAKEYILYHYGPAGQAVADYFALCHQRYQETLKGTMAGNYPAGFYSEEFTSKAVALLSDARKAVAGDRDLRDELAMAQREFIMDWVKHPLSKEMTPAAKEILRQQCAALAAMGGTSDKEKIALAQEIHAVGVSAEGAQKGALTVVEAWLKEQNFPKPKLVEKIPGGVRIPAPAFMYAGWNGIYTGLEHVVPAKPAVGVYVKGNSADRSDRTEAEFDLDELPGDGSAVLDIEGQDCDHEVPASEIRIEINGRKVFEGQITVVKWMWSRQEFKIPAGVLKQGTNKIEVTNIVDPKSVKNWYERWFIFTEAVVRFNK